MIGDEMTLLAAWHTLDEAERRARLRSLAMGARLLAGEKAAPLIAALALAEGDPAALADADAELARLPTLPMRRLLATFAATLPPSATGGCHGLSLSASLSRRFAATRDGITTR